MEFLFADALVKVNKNMILYYRLNQTGQFLIKAISLQQGRKLFSHPINIHYLNTFFIVMNFGPLKILMNSYYAKNAVRKIETFN